MRHNIREIDGGVGGMSAVDLAVVPAQAGTHSHSPSKFSTVVPQRSGHGVWVPAFAGTPAAG